MGQKVSPVGLRIGINKGWESNWYAEGKDFAKNLNSDYQIRKFLEKKLKGKVEIAVSGFDCIDVVNKGVSK